MVVYSRDNKGVGVAYGIIKLPKKPASDDGAIKLSPNKLFDWP